MRSSHAENVHQKLAEYGVQWKFIPSRAPSMVDDGRDSLDLLTESSWTFKDKYGDSSHHSNGNSSEC